MYFKSMTTAAALLTLSLGAHAADPQAGKAAAQKCVQCHAADDWEGESAVSLEGIMLDIVAGKVRHRTPIQLSPTEIANIAAYWATSSAPQRR
jgi:mono/diheme cytochrome c family protein